MADIPFYTDWKFWSAFASFIAIILFRNYLIFASGLELPN